MRPHIVPGGALSDHALRDVASHDIAGSPTNGSRRR